MNEPGQQDATTFLHLRQWEKLYAATNKFDTSIIIMVFASLIIRFKVFMVFFWLCKDSLKLLDYQYML